MTRANWPRSRLTLMAAGSITTNTMPVSIAFNARSIGVSRQKLFVQLEGV